MQMSLVKTVWELFGFELSVFASVSYGENILVLRVGFVLVEFADNTKEIRFARLILPNCKPCLRHG